MKIRVISSVTVIIVITIITITEFYKILKNILFLYSKTPVKVKFFVKKRKKKLFYK